MENDRGSLQHMWVHVLTDTGIFKNAKSMMKMTTQAVYPCINCQIPLNNV